MRTLKGFGVLAVGALLLLLWAGGAALRSLPWVAERVIEEFLQCDAKVRLTQWEFPGRFVFEEVQGSGFRFSRGSDVGFFIERATVDLSFKKRENKILITVENAALQNAEIAAQKKGESFAHPLSALGDRPSDGGEPPLSSGRPRDRRLRRLFSMFDLRIRHGRMEGGRIRVLDVGIQERGFLTVAEDVSADYRSETLGGGAPGRKTLTVQGKLRQGREAGALAAFRLKAQKDPEGPLQWNAEINEVWMPYWQPYIQKFFEADVLEGVLLVRASGSWLEDKVQARVGMKMSQLMGYLNSAALPSELGVSVLTESTPRAFISALWRQTQLGLDREIALLRPSKIDPLPRASTEDLILSAESSKPRRPGEDWRSLRASAE